MCQPKDPTLKNLTNTVERPCAVWYGIVYQMAGLHANNPRYVDLWLILRDHIALGE